MKIKEIRALSAQELKEKLSHFKKEIMDFEFKRRGTVEKPHLFKINRKAIARIMTVLKEKANESGKK
ncbi:MAG: 50S ribosomal protein L29 [Candidatus Omnitrophota bacterium]